MRSADALLLVTPKYNGTIPATLKNAIDWISRPYPSDAVVDKPVAVIGSCGGAAAAHVLMRTPAKQACIAGANLLNNVTLSVLHGATPFADTPAACDDKIATAITAILATLADATNPTKPHGSLMCTEPKTAAPPPVRWSRHLARRKLHYHPQYGAKTTCVDFSR